MLYVEKAGSNDQGRCLRSKLFNSRGRIDDGLLLRRLIFDKVCNYRPGLYTSPSLPKPAPVLGILFELAKLLEKWGTTSLKDEKEGKRDGVWSCWSLP